MSDLISRQDAITIPITPKEDREYQTYNLDDAYERGWEDLEKKIEQLPSVDAIPIEWIRKWASINYIESEYDVSVGMIEDWEEENE